MILKVLMQSSTSVTEGQNTHAVTDLFRVGDFQFIRPSILWHNNKTYLGADKGNESIAGFQNDIIMLQYDHNLDLLSYIDVGSGAGENDINNHPACWVWIENDYIYCGQAHPHNEGTSRFKSNSTNNINSGFTELNLVTNDYSYTKAFITHDNKFAFNFRFDFRGTSPPNFDNIGIVKSNTSSIEGTFSEILICENTTIGYRYYNSCPVVYGNPTKTFFTPTMRKDGTVNYFANCVLITDDFETFVNYQGTASKNVVSVSPFTTAEIEADYTINGSTSSDTAEVKVMNTIQVNDVLYGTYIKEGTSDWYIFKIDGTVFTETNLSSQITEIRTDAFLNNFMYWNGSNIVLSVLTNDGSINKKELWAINGELSVFTQKYVNDMELAYNDPIKLPENLDQVSGYYSMWIDNQLGVTDYVILYNTNDKWLL